MLRRSAVSLGRSTDAKGDVDVDLGKAAGEAGLGGRASRLQAQLLLTADGLWSITNTGRSPLAVNGQQVRGVVDAVLREVRAWEMVCTRRAPTAAPGVEAACGRRCP